MEFDHHDRRSKRLQWVIFCIVVDYKQFSLNARGCEELYVRHPSGPSPRGQPPPSRLSAQRRGGGRQGGGMGADSGGWGRRGGALTILRRDDPPALLRRARDTRKRARTQCGLLFIEGTAGVLDSCAQSAYQPL